MNPKPYTLNPKHKKKLLEKNGIFFRKKWFSGKIFGINKDVSKKLDPSDAGPTCT